MESLTWAKVLRDAAGLPRTPPILGNWSMTRRELVRECRSKRRRIVKKWRNNPANWRTVPRQDILVVPGLGWVCHPSVAARLRRALTDYSRV